MIIVVEDQGHGTEGDGEDVDNLGSTIRVVVISI